MNTTPKHFSQEALFKVLEPAFKGEGKKYRKFKEVLIRKAKEGERIQTITADGLETENKAGSDDYIVQNLTEASESYLISKEKLAERYAFVEAKDAECSLYKPIGSILAIQLTEELIQAYDLSSEFNFVASWGEDMVAKSGDFLVLTDQHEIYRIAQKEFFETYEPC